jgi:hypothetical protein
MKVFKFINAIFTQHTNIYSCLICRWANQPKTCDVLHMRHEEIFVCCVKTALINLKLISIIIVLHLTVIRDRYHLVSVHPILTFYISLIKYVSYFCDLLSFHMCNFYCKVY